MSFRVEFSGADASVLCEMRVPPGSTPECSSRRGHRDEKREWSGDDGGARSRSATWCKRTGGRVRGSRPVPEDHYRGKGEQE